MSEMTAVEYLKTKTRMVKVDENGGCTILCKTCPLDNRNNGTNTHCSFFEKLYPEEAVFTVQKWGEEHPEKTILQDFLEKYPNAFLESDGTPAFCPTALGYQYDDELCDSIVDNKCKKCWSRPLEE